MTQHLKSGETSNSRCESRVGWILKPFWELKTQLWEDTVLWVTLSFQHRCITIFWCLHRGYESCYIFKKWRAAYWMLWLMFATSLDLPLWEASAVCPTVWGGHKLEGSSPLRAPSHNVPPVLGFQVLSPWYDEFLVEEDYWFLVFTVGGTLGCGRFGREGEIFLL